MNSDLAKHHAGLDRYVLTLLSGSIPWEIGNAFSAMFKQNRLSVEEAQKGLLIFSSIPLRYIEPDFIKVMHLSQKKQHVCIRCIFFGLRYQT